MRLIGEGAIIEFLGWNRSKFQKHRKMLKDDGILIYEFRGRPQKKCVTTFSNTLEIYMAEKSRQGFIF